jgi:hypothetical protein
LNAICTMPWNWHRSDVPVNATGVVWKRRIVPETTRSPARIGSTSAARGSGTPPRSRAERDLEPGSREWLPKTATLIASRRAAPRPAAGE